MQRHHRNAPSSFRTERGLTALLLGLTLALGACGQQAALQNAGGDQKLRVASPPLGNGDLGPNVRVFDPSMPLSEIQATVNAIAKEQVSNQFGDQRYALLFKPGTYGSAEHPLIIQVGYYTEVAGLGQSPGDVTINGHVDVYNQCFPTQPGAPTDCTALVNFWRSVSNLTINVQGKGLDGCRASANFWAVSQAAPMRRVSVVGGNLSLMDYCTAGPQYASGGFLADTKTGFIINGSQQQFLVRNSAIGGWSNGVWNQVFAGVVGAPPQSFPNPPYTTLTRTPVSREKPYLFLDGQGRLGVFVPAAARDTSGTTWQSAPTPGRTVPLSDFFVARPSDSAQTINSELARGRNLIFTPGVYDIDRTIEVKRPNTVVLGLGIATLKAQGGAVPMAVADVPGVDISGLMFDAGPVNSPVLLRLGTRHAEQGQAREHNDWSDPANPSALQDVFFRIGGAHVGKATVSLEVNSDHTILDDLWAWRADHGEGVGWTVNTADHGVIVNGEGVTATGLFVEHYQKEEVLWNGEGGQTVMFQNEMPYDAPNQAAWQHGGEPGYAAYKVADTVQTHEGWGLGSYIYTNVDPSIHAAHGFEVPVTAGVRLHDLLTVELGAGTIDHVINDTGAPVTSAAVGVPSDVVSYP